MQNCTQIKLGGFYFCELLKSPDSRINISVNRRRHIYYNWFVDENLIGLDYDLWLVLVLMIFRLLN